LPDGWNRALIGSIEAVLSAGSNWDLGGGFQLRASSGQPGLAPGLYRLSPRSACPNIKRGHPFERHHSQTLKNLLQEFRLEPWLRDRVPLVLSGDQLVAVADLWVERDFIQRDSAGLRLSWNWSRNGRVD
jgi:tRNA(Ile)-lysidine synthase